MRIFNTWNIFVVPVHLMQFIYTEVTENESNEFEYVSGYAYESVQAMKRAESRMLHVRGLMILVSKALLILKLGSCRLISQYSIRWLPK